MKINLKTCETGGATLGDVMTELEITESATKAFMTAASRLGISPLQLAEALQDGGIADAFEALAGLMVGNTRYHDTWGTKSIPRDDALDKARAILAKIRKEGE